ncbi:MAG: tRNA preQ1(34) S-adenosylmethionine ribosyltransferase-isomerase QueA [Clostridia bacterium]|nr:tRNA preQ1(34) S-adenosylmethionine ribosyltransferase-isomerase QueA [Clostridia bacterium]
MKLEEFDYILPPELIAQTPIEPRDHSRLLVLDKQSDSVIHHRYFTEIVNYLEPGDVLITNNTRVIPARLLGEKEGTGAKIEVVLLTRKDKNTWEALVKPGKKIGMGTRIIFGDGLLAAEAIDTTPAGGRILSFSYEGIFEEILDKLGMMPLPPYITTQLEDKERYQTVYAKIEGSAAAPTAGLHFTPNLIQQIKDKGVHWEEVLLHVGLGTFRPVKAEDIREHQMHAEFFKVSQETAQIVNRAKESGGKIIAVGTTSVRALESAVDGEQLAAKEGWTDIYIYPGYRFKIIDGMITNFHLPKSTLMMLISALAGRDKVMKAYQEAADKKYRFYSFGDAMLII